MCSTTSIISGWSASATGGQCYRAVVEVQLAGVDLLSDRSLLADEATLRLQGEHALASYATLWRFCAGANLGRAAKAAAGDAGPGVGAGRRSRSGAADH